MSDELNEELDPTNEQVDPEITDDIENPDAQPGNEDKPKYTELERKLYARAKKAEAEVRELKKPKEQPKQEDKQTNPNPNPTTEQIEELLLRDKGFDDEAIAKLKVIAKGASLGLLAAKEDPLFKSWNSDREAEKKKAEAKLGASTGSGRTGSKKGFVTPGLSDEEHKQMWKEKQGS